ncbi:putative tail tube protein [Vibrio coralliirubri]|uniref:phage protein n=1 Tax=Vibrio coralliirubri TaxID=1516159 RepID=UPI00063450BB|nr:phage protein [Vibrio coralliirubri]CDT98574.1 putative tail tube protein [Vibrio coralliirubri]
MNARYTGRSFDVNILGVLVHVESATATISDESAVDKEKGIPTGFTHGAVGCEVEYELDLNNFRKLQQKAREAGSWRGIKPHDCMFYANTGGAEDKIEVFGVKLQISDLLSVDPNSSDKSKRKLTGFSTSPHFVRINGIPYLSDDDTRGLL